MNSPNQSQPRERRIYLAASVIDDPVDLAAFLDSACGNNTRLRIRITKLLEVESRLQLEPDPLIREVLAKLLASEWPHPADDE
ncbi:MAG: hypothetical protein P1U89_26865 [Verrucomicrobiales bacterium]|nr:hypothetical protein [Verrucomicrobiales bacterium]